jgi:polar amino acid transport system substrate-binding protein
MVTRAKVLRGGVGALLLAATMALGAVPAAAQQPDILSKVVQRGTLRIATIAGNPPYSALDANGQPTGYDIEIGKRLAASLNVKPEFIIVDVPGRIAALQTGRADVTIANFTDTVERSKTIAFTRPYVVVGSVFMVLKDSPIQTVAQLNDPKYNVAFARGATSEQTCDLAAPKAKKLRFDTVGDGFLALQSKQADAQLQDSLQARAYVEKEPGKYRLLPGNFSYEEIAIGLPAGDFDWWRIVDTWVRQFNNSDDNNRLFRQYFGYDLPPLN